MQRTFRLPTILGDDALQRMQDRQAGRTVEQLPDGRLRVSPTFASGGMRNAHLAVELGIWARRTRLGPTFDSSTGFRLPGGELFCPDGAFVRAKRWDAMSRADRERFFPGAPDAAFEIVSATDSPIWQREKCAIYARAGASLVALIDPYRRSVERWLDGEHAALGEIAELDCEPVMPGFVLDVTTLLAA